MAAYVGPASTNNPMPQNQTALVSEPGTNQLLAMYALMTANKAALVGGLLPEEPLWDAEVEAVPRRLAGTITIKRNSTQRALPRSLNTPPSRNNSAAVALGTHLAHDLLKLGMPETLAGQAHAIATVLETLLPLHARNGLDRRGPLFAEAAARYLIQHCQPEKLQFAHRGKLRRWYLDDTEHENVVPLNEEPEADTGAGSRLFERPSLVWTHHNGPRDGLLVDRLHHTFRGGVIERDAWTHKEVAKEMKAAAAFLARCHAGEEALLGVRVLAHRAPNVGVHFLPDFSDGAANPVGGAHHRVGGCNHCAVRTIHPNTSSEGGGR